MPQLFGNTLGSEVIVMYKFLGIVFAVILLLFCAPTSDFLGNLPSESGRVSFCVNERVEILDANITQNGSGYIISAPTDRARVVQNALRPEIIQGVIYMSTQKIDISEYLGRIGATIYEEENIDGMHFICAFSPQFSRFVSYNGQKINIQIAISPELTTIGYPLILCGA